MFEAGLDDFYGTVVQEDDLATEEFITAATYRWLSLQLLSALRGVG